MKTFLISASSENAKHETHLTNLFKEFYFKERSYPLGIAYLGAILEKNGCEVRLFDFFNKPLDEVESEFLETVKKESPEVVGFSILSMNRTASFELIKKIKVQNSKIKIIAGGVHCSVLYEQLLRNFPIDACCLAEGENVITPLVNSVNDLKKLENVPGIAFLNEKKELIVTTPPKQTDLNSVPFPKHEAFLTKKSKVMYMITSRGCAGKCIFCSTNSYWRGWRARSAKNVVDEIEYVKLKFPKIEKVFFHDDTFILDNNRAIEICREIIKRNIKIKWVCPARVCPISAEMLEWFKKAGCEQIMFGVESGSDRMLQQMKKYITRKQIMNAFKLTQEAGIKVGAFLLIGLPTESDETIDETIDLLKKMHYAVDSAAILELYPNTEMYRIAKEQGFITDEYWLTDKKIPLYTYEHPLSKLLQMKLRIIYETIKHKGILYLVIYLFRKAILEPHLVIKAVISMCHK